MGFCSARHFAIWILTARKLQVNFRRALAQSWENKGQPASQQSGFAQKKPMVGCRNGKADRWLLVSVSSLQINSARRRRRRLRLKEHLSGFARYLGDFFLSTFARAQIDSMRTKRIVKLAQTNSISSAHIYV